MEMSAVWCCLVLVHGDDAESCAGTTARLVSKYRPPVPILTLVVPTLSCKDKLSWQLSGKACARQCLIQRGILPCLASEEGELQCLQARSCSFQLGCQQYALEIFSKVHHYRHPRMGRSTFASSSVQKGGRERTVPPQCKTD